MYVIYILTKTQCMHRWVFAPGVHFVRAVFVCRAEQPPPTARTFSDPRSQVTCTVLVVVVVVIVISCCDTISPMHGK